MFVIDNWAVIDCQLLIQHIGLFTQILCDRRFRHTKDMWLRPYRHASTIVPLPTRTVLILC